MTAALPDYARIMFDGHAMEFDPGVIKSEMDKGLPKMRVSQSRVIVHLKAYLLFKTAQASIDFEDWYFDTIKRIGWFTIPDPRIEGQTLTVRFKDADIGTLEPMTGAYAVSRRSVTFEYLR